MEKFIKCLLVFSLLAFAGNVSAQKKIPADSVVISADIHCNACLAKIEKNIPFERGVKEIKTDMEQKKVTVFYDPSKTNPENILKGFAKFKMKAEIDK